MSDLDNAISAVSRGEKVSVSPSIPNQAGATTKAQSHLVDGDNIVVVIVPATSTKDPAEALSALLNAAPGDQAVVVLIAGSEVQAADKGYELNAADMMDRATSINNDPLDAVGTFARLVHKGQTAEAVHVPVDAPAGVPANDAPVFPVAVPLAVSLVGLAATIAVLVRRRKKRAQGEGHPFSSGRSEAATAERWKQVSKTPPERLTPAEWGIIAECVHQAAPGNLNHTQSAVWSASARQLREIGDNWGAVQRMGIAAELREIAGYFMAGALNYGRLPADVIGKKDTRGITPSEALDKQLQALQERTSQLRMASFTESLDQLDRQGILLDVKYGDDLDYMGLGKYPVFSCLHPVNKLSPGAGTVVSRHSPSGRGEPTQEHHHVEPETPGPQPGHQTAEAHRRTGAPGQGRENARRARVPHRRRGRRRPDALPHPRLHEQPRHQGPPPHGGPGRTPPAHHPPRRRPEGVLNP